MTLVIQYMHTCMYILNLEIPTKFKYVLLIYFLMVTKRFSSATQKLREKQKKTAKAVRQQATRESDAKKREYTSRMQPEKKLDPAQEERCKGIVTRVLKKI